MLKVPLHIVTASLGVQDDSAFITGPPWIAGNSHGRAGADTEIAVAADTDRLCGNC